MLEGQKFFKCLRVENFKYAPVKNSLAVNFGAQ